MVGYNQSQKESFLWSRYLTVLETKGFKNPERSKDDILHLIVVELDRVHRGGGLTEDG